MSGYSHTDGRGIFGRRIGLHKILLVRKHNYFYNVNILTITLPFEVLACIKGASKFVRRKSGTGSELSRQARTRMEARPSGRT